jgi:transcriptional regulator with XRE-family HTH domain
MSVDQELLGQLIREERESRQLSQEGLAALSGLSRTYIGEIERGRAALSFASLVAIASGFGMQPSELVREYEKRHAGRG